MIKSNENASATFAGTVIDHSERLLFFSGSNSTDSINQKLLTALAVQSNDRKVTLIDLNDFPMPMYSDKEEAKGIPQETINLLKVIEDYNLLVIAVPEHNSSMPAFFKNVLDWLSRARPNYRIATQKKIILLNASPGKGGKNAVLNAGVVLKALGANIIGLAVLNDFYKNTITVNEQLQITDAIFLSKFHTLLTTTLKIEL